jgi:hypothetical protein
VEVSANSERRQQLDTAKEPSIAGWLCDVSFRLLVAQEMTARWLPEAGYALGLFKQHACVVRVNGACRLASHLDDGV